MTIRVMIYVAGLFLFHATCVPGSSHQERLLARDYNVNDVVRPKSNRRLRESGLNSQQQLDTRPMGWAPSLPQDTASAAQHDPATMSEDIRQEVIISETAELPTASPAAAEDKQPEAVVGFESRRVKADEAEPHASAHLHIVYDDSALGNAGGTQSYQNAGLLGPGTQAKHTSSLLGHSKNVPYAPSESGTGNTAAVDSNGVMGGTRHRESVSVVRPPAVRSGDVAGTRHKPSPVESQLGLMALFEFRPEKLHFAPKALVQPTLTHRGPQSGAGPSRGAAGPESPHSTTLVELADNITVLTDMITGEGTRISVGEGTQVDAGDGTRANSEKPAGSGASIMSVTQSRLENAWGESTPEEVIIAGIARHVSEAGVSGAAEKSDGQKPSIDWPAESIPGKPNTDYPALASLPHSEFACKQQRFDGFYADVSNDVRCQAFWVCHKGQQDGFLCPNGTVFNQRYITCDWWFNVRCADSPLYFALNKNIGVVGISDTQSPAEVSFADSARSYDIPALTPMSTMLQYPRVPPMLPHSKFLHKSMEERSVSEHDLSSPDLHFTDDLSLPDASTVQIIGGVPGSPPSETRSKFNSLSKAWQRNSGARSMQIAQKSIQTGKRKFKRRTALEPKNNFNPDISSSKTSRHLRAVNDASSPMGQVATGVESINSQLSSKIPQLQQSEIVPLQTSDYIRTTDQEAGVSSPETRSFQSEIVPLQTSDYIRSTAQEAGVSSPETRSFQPVNGGLNKFPSGLEAVDKVSFPMDSKDQGFPRVEEDFSVGEHGNSKKIMTVDDVLPYHASIPAATNVLRDSEKASPYSPLAPGSPSQIDGSPLQMNGLPGHQNDGDAGKFATLSLSENVQLGQRDSIPPSSVSQNSQLEPRESSAKRQNGNSHLTSLGQTALGMADLSPVGAQNVNIPSPRATGDPVRVPGLTSSSGVVSDPSTGFQGAPAPTGDTGSQGSSQQDPVPVSSYISERSSANGQSSLANTLPKQDTIGESTSASAAGALNHPPQVPGVEPIHMSVGEQFGPELGNQGSNSPNSLVVQPPITPGNAPPPQLPSNENSSMGNGPGSMNSLGLSPGSNGWGTDVDLANSILSDASNKAEEIVVEQSKTEVILPQYNGGGISSGLNGLDMLTNGGTNMTAGKRSDSDQKSTSGGGSMLSGVPSGQLVAGKSPQGNDAEIDSSSGVRSRPESAEITKHLDSFSQISNGDRVHPNVFMSHTQVQEHQLDLHKGLPDNVEDPSALNREMPSEKMKGIPPPVQPPKEKEGALRPGKKNVQITSESVSRIIKHPSRHRSAIKDPAGIDLPEIMKPPSFGPMSRGQGIVGFTQEDMVMTTVAPDPPTVRSSLKGTIDVNSDQTAVQGIQSAGSVDALANYQNPSMSGVRLNAHPQTPKVVRSVVRHVPRASTSITAGKQFWSVDTGDENLASFIGGVQDMSVSSESLGTSDEYSASGDSHFDYITAQLASRLDETLRMVDDILGPPPFKPKRHSDANNHNSRKMTNNHNSWVSTLSQGANRRRTTNEDPGKSDPNIDLTVLVKENPSNTAPSYSLQASDKYIANVGRPQSPHDSGKDETARIYVTPSDTAARKKQNGGSHVKNVENILKIKTETDDSSTGSDVKYDYDVDSLPSWMLKPDHNHGKSSISNKIANSPPNNGELEKVVSIVNVYDSPSLTARDTRSVDSIAAGSTSQQEQLNKLQKRLRSSKAQLLQALGNRIKTQTQV